MCKCGLLREDTRNTHCRELTLILLFSDPKIHTSVKDSQMSNQVSFDACRHYKMIHKGTDHNQDTDDKERGRRLGNPQLKRKAFNAVKF